MTRPDAATAFTVRRAAMSACLAAAAAAATAAMSSVQAQMPSESAQAAVRRQQPAEAAFTESIAGRLRVPPGFVVNVFASGLGNPRMLDIGADGTVYVTRRSQGDVLALRDADGDGRAEQRHVFASGLKGVHGISVRGAEVVLASQTTVWKSPLGAFGSSAVPSVIVSGLPDGGQHPNRMVRHGPDGGLYVSVGSSCNDCAEDNQLERATMIRYAADGSAREVLATGLRNTIGYDWHPVTGALWGMDHGSDFRGDTLPPEELNQIVAGRNYGWPICCGQQVVDPMTNASPSRMALQPGQAQPLNVPMTRPAYCAATAPAVLTTAAHSAPMAMRFYRGTQFPAAWRNDAFVAMRGSWNRFDPVGYKVVRVRYSPAGEALAVDDFLTGFLAENDKAFYGRPVGIVVAADGALLVSDDELGAIYRVAYRP